MDDHRSEFYEVGNGMNHLDRVVEWLTLLLRRYYALCFYLGSTRRNQCFHCQFEVRAPFYPASVEVELVLDAQTIIC